jgi:hypothetical protein
MYSLPSYAFIAKDYTTQAALYTHHQYIAGFLMVGAFAHGAIFLIRDYDPKLNENNVLARMLEHKEALISHLSWVSLFLGFHTLGFMSITMWLWHLAPLRSKFWLNPSLLNGFKLHLAKCCTALTLYCLILTALRTRLGRMQAMSGYQVGWMPLTAALTLCS